MGWSCVSWQCGWPRPTHRWRMLWGCLHSMTSWLQFGQDSSKLKVRELPQYWEETAVSPSAVSPGPWLSWLLLEGSSQHRKGASSSAWWGWFPGSSSKAASRLWDRERLPWHPAASREIAGAAQPGSLTGRVRQESVPGAPATSQPLPCKGHLAPRILSGP